MSIFNIKNLTVSFKNKTSNIKVLDSLSLNIESNLLIAITGKSGCGKSTFLNVLYGIEKPTSGKIMFCGNDLDELDDRQWSYYHSRCVSFVFQHYNLLENLTVLENIILPLIISGTSKKEANEKAKTLLEQFNLKDLANNLASNLSGGEKQRVGIIRAIITNPKVILCDEPTGALDSKNSILVMEMFKQISKQITIILVSHNKKLVKKYADRIIEMKDGKIQSDTKKQHKEKVDFLPIKRIMKKDKWSKLFVYKNLKENFKRNVILIASLTFGFICIFLSFGFSFGSKSSQEEATKNNYGLEVATISSIQEYEIENSPLKYEKSVRPELSKLDEKIGDLSFLKFEPNLDYVFNPYPYAKINNQEINGFQMIPKYNRLFQEHLIEYQSENIDQYNGVLVNDEFCKFFGFKSNEILGQNLTINYNDTFTLLTGKNDEPFVKDNYSYQITFEVCGVVREFAFLNSPKIYYLYNYVKDFFDSELLINISRYLHEEVTPYSYIENCKNDDIVSSYSYYIFLTDINKIFDFENLIKNLPQNSNFKITSTPFEVKQNYADFIHTFSDALYVFVIIAFIGVNLILGISSLSNFIEHKKQSAILTCLGANNSKIRSIFLKSNIVLIISSFLLSVICIFPLQSFINTILFKYYYLSNLIKIPFASMFNLPFILPVAILLSAILISAIFVAVPISFYKRISLTNELRDE